MQPANDDEGEHTEQIIDEHDTRQRVVAVDVEGNIQSVNNSRNKTDSQRSSFDKFEMYT